MAGQEFSDLYCEGICLDCGSTDMNALATTVCPHCGGMVPLIHAPKGPQGEKEVRWRIKQLQESPAERAKVKKNLKGR
jgi:hypothetical protein